MLGLPIAIVVLFLVALAEHFVDAEDETSDNGASTGPGADPVPGGTAFGKRLIVTSAVEDRRWLPNPVPETSTFTRPRSMAVRSRPGFDLAHLARRAFPGKWGACDGTQNHSSAWENKTTRYFKKFLSSGRHPVGGDSIGRLQPERSSAAEALTTRVIRRARP